MLKYLVYDLPLILKYYRLYNKFGYVVYKLYIVL